MREAIGPGAQSAIEALEREVLRDIIIKEGKRIDGSEDMMRYAP